MKEFLHELSKTSVPSQWRRQTPLFYVWSSWAYALGGIYVHCNDPYRVSGEVAIWVTQSILTFFSDVVHLGEDSALHSLDRLHAWSMTVLRAVIFWKDARYTEFQRTTFVFGMLLAVLCRLASRRACLDGDAQSFFVWHALWHVAIPLTAVCVAAQSVLNHR